MNIPSLFPLSCVLLTAKGGFDTRTGSHAKLTQNLYRVRVSNGTCEFNTLVSADTQKQAITLAIDAE